MAPKKSRAGRKRAPTAILKERGKKHLTKPEEAQRLSEEVYAASGGIEPPEWLGPVARELFLKEAEYMSRVNTVTGKAMYGAEDIEPLAVMAASYERALVYARLEKAARDPDAKKDCNQMKGKEQATYERMLKLLSLDPSSRVHFPELGGGGDAGTGEDIADII